MIIMILMIIIIMIIVIIIIRPKKRNCLFPVTVLKKIG